jgi:outer membrane protein assembly factor BamB
VNAFRATDGSQIWKTDTLKNRSVSVPYILGRAVVVGDYQGFVHFLNTENGQLIGRAPTDGSAITAAPVMAGNTLVVQTHDGDLYGFRPGN